MNFITQNKNIIISLLLLIASLISIYSLYYFWIYKVYFIGSDAYYYWSIADSGAKNGRFLDTTVIPHELIRTTQLGIVFIHLILSKFGVTGESRFIFIMFLNYFLHLSTIYPINQIAKKVGLTDLLPRIFLIAAFIGAWHIYDTQLKLNNDGFFNSLSVWFTYLLVIIHQDIADLKISSYLSTKNKFFWVIIMAGLLSYILILFRLQMLLIHCSAIFAATFLKKWRALRWNIAFLFISCIALINLLSNVDMLRIFTSVERQSSKILLGFLNEINRTLFDIIPSLLYNYNLDNWVDYIVLPVIIIIVWMFFQAIRQKDQNLLFLTTLCCSALLWVTIFGYNRSRYIFYIYAFMFLLMLFQSRTRLIGFFFVFLVLLSSVYNLVRPFPRPPASRIILYLNENNISLPSGDPLLLSTFERHPYFFLNSSTFQGDLKFGIILEKKGVFILADDKYTQKKISEITSMADKFNYSFQSRSLIPEYDENEIKKRFSIKESLGFKIGKQQYRKSGYDLIQLYNFTKK